MNNGFYGSLEALEKCQNLEKLNINCSFIDKGLVQLSLNSNLVEFSCKGTVFFDELKFFRGDIRE